MLASPIAAQVPQTDSAAFSRIAVDGGIGLIATSPKALAGYRLELSAALPHKRAVIVRYTKVQEYCLFAECEFPDRVSDVAAMYGWMPNTPYGGATLAAGAALLTSYEKDHSGFGDTRSRDFNPAIPIEITGYLMPAPYLAIGLSGTADLAPDHSIAGLFLAIRLSFD